MIGVFAFWPGSVQGSGWGIDKVKHIAAFAALILPVAFLRPGKLVWVVLFALFYGAAIELVQPFVGRSRSWGDFLADLAGIAVGLSLGFGMRGRFLVTARFGPPAAPDDQIL
ncbi:VanZ family protein [Ruegeria intermedia]|uniref:VanZ family protein n=1 Tax=Ruegeria intermedia TaxID=996115 RepID=UPI00165F08F1